jgi:hypothetical protein
MDQGRVRLEFSDYLRAGDKLTVVVNAASNTLVALNVATYLDERDDVVALDVQSVRSRTARATRRRRRSTPRPRISGSPFRIPGTAPWDSDRRAGSVLAMHHDRCTQ